MTVAWRASQKQWMEKTPPVQPFQERPGIPAGGRNGRSYSTSRTPFQNGRNCSYIFHRSPSTSSGRCFQKVSHCLQTNPRTDARFDFRSGEIRWLQKKLERFCVNKQFLDQPTMDRVEWVSSPCCQTQGRGSRDCWYRRGETTGWNIDIAWGVAETFFLRRRY